MTEALKYFLDEEKLEGAILAPDEGVDYIFLLADDEWRILESNWNSRGQDWKESIAYFSGFRKMNVSAKLLLNAVKDSSKKIVEQGLLSMHQSITEQIEEEGKFDHEFSNGNKQFIVERLMEKEEMFEDFPEFPELLALLKK